MTIKISGVMEGLAPAFLARETSGMLPLRFVLSRVRGVPAAVDRGIRMTLYTQV